MGFHKNKNGLVGIIASFLISCSTPQFNSSDKPAFYVTSTTHKYTINFQNHKPYHVSFDMFPQIREVASKLGYEKIFDQVFQDTLPLDIRDKIGPYILEILNLVDVDNSLYLNWADEERALNNPLNTSLRYIKTKTLLDKIDGEIN